MKYEWFSSSIVWVHKKTYVANCYISYLDIKLLNPGIQLMWGLYGVLVTILLIVVLILYKNS